MLDRKPVVHVVYRALPSESGMFCPVIASG
jgi:hypothetical protein